MIERIDNFLKWARTSYSSLIGLISFYGLNYFQNELEKFASLPNQHVFFFSLVIATIVIVILFVKIVDSLLDDAINCIKILRKSIMKNEFVEGWWIDKIVDNSESESKYCAIIKVKYEHGQLEISGAGYNKDGEITHTYRSFFSNYKSFKLSFFWEGDDDKSPTYDYYGYAEYNFVENQHLPLEFRGFFIDNYSVCKRRIKALKIAKKEILDEIDKIDSRRRLAIDYLNNTIAIQ